MDIPRILGTLLIFAITGFFFFRRILRQWSYLKAARPENRFDKLGERFVDFLYYGLGQRRLLKKGYGGILHVFIFWGFCVLSIANLTLILRGFGGDGFNLPFLAEEQGLGMVYNAVKEVFTVLVLVGVSMALYRRLLWKPRFPEHSTEAIIILFVIFALMAVELLWGGAHVATLSLNHQLNDALVTTQPCT